MNDNDSVDQRRHLLLDWLNPEISVDDKLIESMLDYASLEASWLASKNAPQEIPKLAIIAIGTELTDGKFVDTNSAGLAKEFREIGVDVTFHLTVPDKPKPLTQAVAFAIKNADIIVTTGGLGPTSDDITRQTLARATGLPLAISDVHKLALQAKYPDLLITHPVFNQCLKFGEDCLTLSNLMGTAPGLLTTFRDRNNNLKLLIALPGPPKEIESILKSTMPVIKGEILARFPAAVPRLNYTLKTVMPEMLVDQEIDKLLNGLNRPADLEKSIVFDSINNSGELTVTLSCACTNSNVEFIGYLHDKSRLLKTKFYREDRVGDYFMRVVEDFYKRWIRMPFEGLRLFDTTEKEDCDLAARFKDACQKTNRTIEVSLTDTAENIDGTLLLSLGLVTLYKDNVEYVSWSINGSDIKTWRVPIYQAENPNFMLNSLMLHIAKTLDAVQIDSPGEEIFTNHLVSK
jgi:molybdenum cofactor synthesis domain-containing protein